MLKSTIASSCEKPSMFISSTITVNKRSKVSLNPIISFVNNKCSHCITRSLFMSKEIIDNTTAPDFG